MGADAGEKKKPDNSKALVRFKEAPPQEIITTVTPRGIEARIPKDGKKRRPTTMGLIAGVLAGNGARVRSSSKSRSKPKPKPAKEAMSSSQPPVWTKWDPNKISQPATEPSALDHLGSPGYNLGQPVYQNSVPQNQPHQYTYVPNTPFSQQPHESWTETQIREYWRHNPHLFSSHQSQYLAGQQPWDTWTEAQIREYWRQNPHLFSSYPLQQTSSHPVYPGFVYSQPEPYSQPPSQPYQQPQPADPSFQPPPPVPDPPVSSSSQALTTKLSPEGIVLAPDVTDPHLEEPPPLDHHRCARCGNTRSAHYQQNHPLREGETPIPGVCGKCKRDESPGCGSISDSRQSRRRRRRRARTSDIESASTDSFAHEVYRNKVRNMTDRYSYVSMRSSRPRSLSTSRLAGQTRYHSRGGTNIVVQQTVNSPYLRGRSRTRTLETPPVQVVHPTYSSRRSSSRSFVTLSPSRTYSTSLTPEPCVDFVKVPSTRDLSPRVVLARSRSRSRNRVHVTQVVNTGPANLINYPAYPPRQYPWEAAQTYDGRFYVEGPPSPRPRQVYEETNRTFVEPGWQSPPAVRYEAPIPDPGYVYVTEDEEEAERQSLRDRLAELSDRVPRSRRYDVYDTVPESPRVRFVEDDVVETLPPRRRRVHAVDVEYTAPAAPETYYYTRRKSPTLIIDDHSIIRGQVPQAPPSSMKALDDASQSLLAADLWTVMWSETGSSSWMTFRARVHLLWQAHICGVGLDRGPGSIRNHLQGVATFLSALFLLLPLGLTLFARTLLHATDCRLREVFDALADLD
ncbi:MAG: hypothetical protein M1814_002585 [Vezdaea aestivalis]|nr:MAG: hypothetical protein M1814_002585 [Vezdaea aestivalis]